VPGFGTGISAAIMLALFAPKVVGIPLLS